MARDARPLVASARSRVGSPVNLERAVRAAATGSAATSCRATSTAPARSLAVTPDEHWTVVRVSLPDGLGRYVVEKGSITVDGVSPDRRARVEPTTGSRSASSRPRSALTTLGRKGAGRPGQPRGRRHRQVRREAAAGRGRPATGRHEAAAADRATPAPARHASSGRSPTSPPARPVVVVDDEDRENEGDLIFAAEMATPELVAFMIRYTSGYSACR